MFYGVSSQRELMAHIRRACEIISPANVPVAKLLISETCASETRLCGFRDQHFEDGKGPFQFDSVGFEDVKKRFAARKPETVEQLRVETGILWGRVTFEMLEYAPLLGAVLCRAKYYLVPEAIPLDREGRAKYWKKWYNSELGKGTVEHYMDCSARFLGDEIALG